MLIITLLHTLSLPERMLLIRYTMASYAAAALLPPPCRDDAVTADIVAFSLPLIGAPPRPRLLIRWLFRVLFITYAMPTPEAILSLLLFRHYFRADAGLRLTPPRPH